MIILCTFHCIPRPGIESMLNKYLGFFWFGVFSFLGTHPRLGVELEMQLQAYTTAMAMPDPSGIFNLHPQLWQRQILNPMNEARDQARILMDTMSGP